MLVTEGMPASQANLSLENPASRRLFRYWERLRGNRAAPTRNDINLHDLAPFITELGIIERGGEQREPLWRLAGSNLCALFSCEVTGKPVNFAFDQFERDVINRFIGLALDSFQPCILKWRFVPITGFDVEAEFVGVPLIARDGHSRQVLAGVFAENGPVPTPLRNVVSVGLGGARSIWTEALPGDALVAGSASAILAQRPVLQVIRGGKC